MQALSNLFWHDGALFGIDWSVWKVVGWMGNLVIHRRNKAAQSVCNRCGQKNPPQANYCPGCGVKVA